MVKLKAITVAQATIDRLLSAGVHMAELSQS